MTPDEFEKLPIPKQYALISLSSHRRNPAGAERFVRSEFVSEKIEGDTGEVVYRTSDGAEFSMRLRREGILWKLASPRF